MCLIIKTTKNYIENNGRIPRQEFYHAFSENQDGLGMLIWNKNEVQYIKTLMNFNMIDKAYNVYKHAKNMYKDYNFALHFRRATVGTVNEDNIHPFIIEYKPNCKVYLMMNGSMSYLKKIGCKDCDTKILTEDVIAKILKLDCSLNQRFNMIRRLLRDISNTNGARFLCLIKEEGHDTIEIKSGVWSNVEHINGLSMSNNRIINIWDIDESAYLDTKIVEQFTNKKTKKVSYNKITKMIKESTLTLLGRRKFKSSKNIVEKELKIKEIIENIY